jgi:Protein of unknown function (DUF2917)
MNTMTMKLNQRPFVQCTDAPLTLLAHEFVAIKRGQGTCLQCLRGSVWVTLENDPLDMILKSGDRVCIKVPGSVVIEGLEQSQLLLTPTSSISTFSKLIGFCRSLWFNVLGRADRAVSCTVVSNPLHACLYRYFHRTFHQQAVDAHHTYYGSFRL